jgi:hypothetical protein
MPEQERAAWLASLRRENPSVAARVETLLGEQRLLAQEGFLEEGSPPLTGEPELLPRSDGELSAGDTIGAYRIVSPIGRGGMGSVYLAERADGAFEQRAALKVVQSSNARFLLDRFQQERRILALLSHPNIAHILDGGQTPSGLPYLLMEYVPGQPIDQFCDEQKLDLRRRLELFLKVCDAVEHAHRNLVVHRDLKPSNILVTENGVPKLLDFGIAKFVDPAHVEVASTRLLTPEYASPEQVRGDPITTATDVYSSGAVLYKLLTGRPPHSIGEMPPLAAAKLISEHDVPAASTIRSGIPSDVDAILARALHKDVARRYRSVADLSRDIRHYLEGRPVLAAPDSVTYRVQRFVGRHALVTAAGALAIASLIGGSAISIVQARRAQHRFQQVRHLANVFLFEFERSIQNIPGTLEARKLVASTAQRYLEQLLAESGGDAGLQREIAEAYERLSEIENALQSGDPKWSAVESLRRAYDIRRDLGDERSADVTQRASFINLAGTLAERYQRDRNAAEAARWGDEATRLAVAWVDSEPQRPEALAAAWRALRRQGTRLETAGQVSRSRESFEKSLEFAERVRAIGALGHEADYNLALTEYTYSNMLLNLKDTAGALTHAQRSLALMEHLHHVDASNPKWRRVYQLSLSSAGIAHFALADSDPRHLPVSVQLLERAHLIASETMKADPKDTRAKDDFIAQCHRLARSLTASGRQDAAAALYEQAGKAAGDLTRQNPHNRRNWYLLAKNQIDYGILRLDQGRFGEARQLLLSADAPVARGLGLDASDAVLLETHASQLHALARVADRLRDRGSAQRSITQCLDVISGMIARDPSAKDYIGEYSQMLDFARRVGVSTRNLH